MAAGPPVICRRENNTKKMQIRQLSGNRDRCSDRQSALFRCVVLMMLAMISVTVPASAQTMDDAGPWLVKSNGKEIARVRTREEGLLVIDGLRIEYGKTLAGAIRARPEDMLTVEKAEPGAYKQTDIQTVTDAVRSIKAADQMFRPPVTMRVRREIEEERPVKRPVRVIGTDKLAPGEIKVEKTGSDGRKAVIRKVTLKNGEFEKSEVVGDTVESEAEEAVVLEGAGLTAEEKGELVIDYATRFIGTEYVWGGDDLRKGIDCSGFTKAVYALFGVELPRHSSDQAGFGEEVDYEDARAGDIICYSGHVALYIGDGKIIHATPGMVQISEKADYRPILTIRRVFKNAADGSKDDEMDKHAVQKTIADTEPNDNDAAREATEERNRNCAAREKENEKKIREALKRAYSKSATRENAINESATKDRLV